MSSAWVSARLRSRRCGGRCPSTANWCSSGLLPNPPSQRAGASVAALPLASAAERQHRWMDEVDVVS